MSNSHILLSGFSPSLRLRLSATLGAQKNGWAGKQACLHLRLNKRAEQKGMQNGVSRGSCGLFFQGYFRFIVYCFFERRLLFLSTGRIHRNSRVILIEIQIQRLFIVVYPIKCSVDEVWNHLNYFTRPGQDALVVLVKRHVFPRPCLAGADKNRVASHSGETS